MLSVKKGAQWVEASSEELSPVFSKFADEIAAAEDNRPAKAAAAAEAEAEGSECVKSARCYLRPYRPNSNQDGCCPGQTGHHIPPSACFKAEGGGYQQGYSLSKALCVCMEGTNQNCGSHGKNHAATEWLAEQKGIAPGQPCSRIDYSSMCAATVAAQCGCDKRCIEAQLNQQFSDIKDVKHTDTNSSAGVTPKLQERIRDSAGLPADETIGR